MCSELWSTRRWTQVDVVVTLGIAGEDTEGADDDYGVKYVFHDIDVCEW